VEFFDVSGEKSVVFVTLHKCASQLFARQVLPRLAGRTHVDYQFLHYENRLDSAVAVEGNAHAYGPVRILDDDHPSRGITEEILTGSRRQALKAIFFIRDPRDILVSMYYSFGFSHPESPNPEIREYQRLRRQRIQALDIDAFAMAEAPAVERKFIRIFDLFQEWDDKVMLKYEEMIGDFDRFFTRLHTFMKISAGFRKRMEQLTRPQEVENVRQHKRLGQPGNFRDKLKPETIAALDQSLARTLRDFQY